MQCLHRRNKQVADIPFSQERTTKTMAENRLFISPIAEPLASDKMSKKLIKLIKKGMKDKLIHRGVKETVKAVRKGKQG